jgi:hypothetical protein
MSGGAGWGGAEGAASQGVAALRETFPTLNEAAETDDGWRVLTVADVAGFAVLEAVPSALRAGLAHSIRAGAYVLDADEVERDPLQRARGLCAHQRGEGGMRQRPRERQRERENARERAG